MASTRQATLCKPNEGRTIAVLGDTYRLLVTGAETGGKYAMWEAIVPPGGGPPPHVHSREEESFFVLEGEVSFQVGEQKIVAGPGTFANMPIGSLHCFKNNTNQPVRMLISVAPAGFEEMFFELGQDLEAGQQATPPTADDVAKLLAIAPNFGLEIKPPPA